jgi:hypothetical protein
LDHPNTLKRSNFWLKSTVFASALKMPKSEPLAPASTANPAPTSTHPLTLPLASLVATPVEVSVDRLAAAFSWNARVAEASRSKKILAEAILRALMPKLICSDRHASMLGCG